MPEPGTADVSPSVLVIERSPTLSMCVESDAMLLLGLGSAAPAGESMPAELVIVPLAPVTVASIANVADAPTPSVTSWLRSPLPEAAHTAPALGVHVHVAPDTATG